MANDTHRELWCFIKAKSDSKPFRVTPLREASIDELKDEVWKKRRNGALRGADATDLVLWKLNQPVLIKPSRDLANRIGLLGDLSKCAIELQEPSDTVLDEFPEELVARSVHIVVESDGALAGISPSASKDSKISHSVASDTLKRSHSPQPSDSAKRFKIDIQPLDAWLSELHSKIWGRENLRLELFREANITVADYKKLQKHLTVLQPGRALPNYTGIDVQSIKLDILRSLNPPSPVPPGRNDDVVGMEQTEDGEDNEGLDDELRSFFPATIHYLDLSSLKLSNPPRRLPLPLLIRDEYNVISKLLDDLPKDNSGSAIVSGQPGIGKTAYIHLKMIEYMIQRRPFIYQTLDGDVYEVSDTCVSIDKHWSPTAPITAFLDADSDSFTLRPFLNHPYVQLILASSPKGTSSSYLRQLAQDGIMMRFVAALWSPNEFFLTGIFLHSRDLTYARLKESTSYFGFSPRRCFHASRSHSVMVQLKLDVMEKIRDIPLMTDILSLLKKTYTTSSLSHSIFELSPKDDMRLLGSARVGTVSMWALDLLLKQYETRQADAAAEFFNSIAGIPSAGSLRGRIMERQVLKHFDCLKDPHIFELRSLADSSIAQWKYPGPTLRSTFQSQTFTTSLESAVDARDPLHLVPLDPNFPAVDSILYDPGEVLTGIQVTIRNEHPVAVSGLKRVQGWLKLKGPLAHLRPSIMGDHWRLIFVVPAATAASFRQQVFEQDTDGNEWARKVDQYVLSIEEDTLWGRTATR